MEGSQHLREINSRKIYSCSPHLKNSNRFGETLHDGKTISKLCPCSMTVPVTPGGTPYPLRPSVPNLHHVCIEQALEFASLPPMASFIGASGPCGFENIKPLTGNNFQTWKDSLLLHLGWHEVGLVLRESKSEEPAKGATGYAELRKAYDTKVEQWEKSNRMALLIMNFSMSAEIKGAIPTKENVTEYLKTVEEQFKASEKVYADEHLHKLLAKYDGHGSVRGHILSMSNVAAKLKTMKCDLNEELLVILVFRSLPSQFNPFKINYNSLETKWKLPELIAHCVHEEERMKSEQKDQVFHVNSGKRKHENNAHGNNVPNKKQFFKKTPPKPKQCNEDAMRQVLYVPLLQQLLHSISQMPVEKGFATFANSQIMSRRIVQVFLSD